MTMKTRPAIHRIVFALAAIGLFCGWASAGEGIQYRSEAAKQFMRRWLLLGPVAPGELSDASQAREALAALGKRNEALKEATQALKIEPDNVEAAKLADKLK